jgi:hypothetical protein
MRVLPPPVRLLRVIAPVLALALAGCRPEPVAPPRATAGLSCADPNGQFVRCGLTLDQSGSVEFVLRDVETCRARGNTIRLVKPLTATLTTDACYEAAGTEWTFGGPYPAGTVIDVEIEAPRLLYPPALRVTGSYPMWRIDFEDGGDDDFDDLKIEVHATP